MFCLLLSGLWKEGGRFFSLLNAAFDCVREIVCVCVCVCVCVRVGELARERERGNIASWHEEIVIIEI